MDPQFFSLPLTLYHIIQNEMDALYLDTLPNVIRKSTYVLSSQ